MLTPTRQRIIVWTAVGLALVLLLASSLTIWVKRQALDTDRWVDASSQMLQDDEVRAALSTRIVNTIFDDPRIQSQIESALPPRLDGLVAPVVGLARQAAVNATDEFLDSSAAQAIWETTNRVAHSSLLRLLEGDDSGALTAEDGAVVLDLGPMIARVEDRLGFAIPPTGREGRIVLMESDQLAAAQNGVKVVRKLSVLAVIVVLALLGGAVWLAEGFRLRVLQVVGIGFVAVGLILMVTRRLVGNAVVDALADSSTRDAASTVWLIGTDLLKDIAVALVVYGAVLLVGAWVAGSSRFAVAARRRLAPLVRGRTVAVYCVVALVFLLLILYGPSNGSRRLAGVLVLAALVGLGVEALRRQILRESPS